MMRLTIALKLKRHIEKDSIRATPSQRLSLNLGSASALGPTQVPPVKIATMGLSLKRGKVVQTTRYTLSVSEMRIYKSSNAAVMDRW